MVAEWRNDLLGVGLAPSTVRVHMSILNGCLNAAVLEGLIEQNPAHGVDGPVQRATERRFLTPEEVLALETAMPSRWALVVPFLVDSRLRIGELAYLRVSDLNLLAGEVRVRGTALGVAKEITGAPTRRVEHDPKTVAGARIVPTLTRGTCDRLATQIAERELGRNSYLFQGNGGQPLDADNWRRRVFRPAVERAGLGGPKVTPHALRHTAIAHWIAAGVTDPLKLARWAGHANVQLTYSVYGHLLPQDASGVQDELERIRREARTAAGKVVQLLRPDQRATS